MRLIQKKKKNHDAQTRKLRLSFLFSRLTSYEIQEGHRINISPSDYFFGPEPFETGSVVSRDDAVGTDPTSPGQVARDRPVNGHAEPGKQIRKEEDDSDESMEDKEQTESQPDTPNHIDGDGDTSMAEEMPEPPVTLENGDSSGTQIAPAKTVDLTPDTALLDVENHVTQLLWRPRDATTVVAAGQDFCSLWKLSLSSEPTEQKIVHQKKGGPLISTVAWDAVGDKLAVATSTADKGTITMYKINGDAVDLLPEVSRAITGLHWADSSSQLIVVASNTHISELALWDDNRRPDVFPPPQIIEDHIHNLDWCGRNQAFGSGDRAIYQFEVDNSIRLTNTYPSRDGATWDYIGCARTENHSVAIAACSAKSLIWIPTHDIFIPHAHPAQITGLEICPRTHSQHVVFATFSQGGKVKVWQVDLDSRVTKCIHQFSLTASNNNLAGCFSPDGYALAAASKDRLSIWNVERGGDPMSTWTAPNSEVKKEDIDRPANGHNGLAKSETPSDWPLAWDSDGKRLAYGFNKKVHSLTWPPRPMEPSHETLPWNPQADDLALQMAIINLQR
jgi:WD40 repeat protein